MRALPILALLMLAACSKPTPPAEPVSAPVSAPVAATDHWVGKYSGDLMVRISGTPGAHRVVLVAATADGCTGDLGLAGGEPAKDDSATEMSLRVKADADKICTLHLRTEGAKIIVAESEACQAFHGPTCTFNGSAIKLH